VLQIDTLSMVFSVGRQGEEKGKGWVRRRNVGEKDKRLLRG
jgi:hypothetical protein